MKNFLINRSMLAAQLSTLIFLMYIPAGRGFANIRVWAAGCTEKIQIDKRSGLPHDAVWDEATRSVKISGVRSEHVPFQIIITADHVNVDGITLKKSALSMRSATLSMENIRLYYEHMIKVYAPSGSHGESGYWPDALVPLTKPFNIRSGERGSPPELRNQPIWVDIEIPQNQPAGVYKGVIPVFAGIEKIGEVFIELTVFDLTLPAERRFPALMSISTREIARMHNLDQDSPEFKALFYKYMELHLNNRVDPMNVGSMGMEGSIGDGNNVIEWTDNETEDFFIRNGLLSFLLSADPPSISYESGEKPFSEDYKRYVKQYIRQVIDHAREKGWHKKLAFLCPVDEPRNAGEYEAIRRWAALIKEVDSNVNIMVTEQPLTQNPEWGSFVGYTNYWIIHGNYLADEEHTRAVSERKQAGETVIWYISCDQLYPQPNYFIDCEAADARMVSWITWRYNLGGILYWATTFWREVKDPWIDPVTWKLSECNAPLSGEGTLIYPGNMAERYTGQENVFGPVTSIRFELLQEGFEELELLNMLKSAGKGSVADQITESVCRGIRDFTRDPNAIDEAKNKIIQELLKRK
ncbi:MAG TPA: glycoside hydrolase domain-containing protein [Cyclobacteriaceae bacterium]|nr:glycoside hydrolase domain-containing protein [Cyclobacteriaceae bacterium]